MTQAQLSLALDAFIIATRGDYVADQQGNYRGECLSLIKKFYGDLLKVYMPGAQHDYFWGDGYYKYFSESLPLPTYFNKEIYISGKRYPKGSIVVYATTHHVAIWIKDNGDGNHTVYEQNADPDHSPAHIGSRADSRVTGILTPRLKENDVYRYPNEGDLTNNYNRTGWPGHPPNANDIAFWTKGTNNPNWGNSGAVWAAFWDVTSKYVDANPPIPATAETLKSNTLYKTP